MNVKSVVENKEKFEVELTIEVGQEEFEAGLDKAYRKNRGSISVPGFRKGKAPRKVIEGMYGAGVFYEDAIEEIYPQACMQAIEEKGLDSVAPPRVEITDLGKEGFTFKAIVTVRPVITLKQYKGLEADKVLPTVTDAAVDNELKQYVDRATQLEPVDRAAEMGDSMVMDYEGVKDGVPFEGGSAKGYELALGSHTFIPGFEEQVVGMKAGEEKTIDLTFPEDYHAKDLAGQPVQFKVKCVEVKEKKVPAIDDEFAKDVSEFETLAEFKEDLKQKIVDRNMAQSEAKFRQALLAQLCEQVDIELPEAMVETQIEPPDGQLCLPPGAAGHQPGAVPAVHADEHRQAPGGPERGRCDPDQAAAGAGRRGGCRGDRGQRRGRGGGGQKGRRQPERSL